MPAKFFGALFLTAKQKVRPPLAYSNQKVSKMFGFRSSAGTHSDDETVKMHREVIDQAK